MGMPTGDTVLEQNVISHDASGNAHVAPSELDFDAVLTAPAGEDVGG